MNYYKRHLGDYARDTGHLTALEHGIYNLLLDWYYVNEKPIPPDKAVKIARGNPEETQSVLSEYFELTENGWVHHYADREIEKYRARADHNRDVGKLGGRPRKSTACEAKNPEITQMVSDKNPEETLATNPLIHNSKKEKKQKTTRETAALDYSSWPSLPSDSILAEWLAVRKRKKAVPTQGVIDRMGAKLAEAGKLGYTVDECLTKAVDRNWQGFEPSWLEPKSRAGPLVNGKPSAAADFRNTTYTGTPYDELPPELR